MWWQAAILARPVVVVLAAVVLCATCGGKTTGAPRPENDGAGEGSAAEGAGQDGGCGRDVGVLSDRDRVRQAMLECGCCSEAEIVCVLVRLSPDGLVVDVVGDSNSDPNPPRAELLACIRNRLVSACLPGLAEGDPRICLGGV